MESELHCYKLSPIPVDVVSSEYAGDVKRKLGRRTGTRIRFDRKAKVQHLAQNSRGQMSMTREAVGGAEVHFR